MNEYLAFWIKEEFADHFFYKNDILYRFLKLYQNNKERMDLHTQYHYITKNFHEHTIISRLNSFHSNCVNHQRLSNQIEVYNDKTHLAVQIEQKYLRFYCKNLSDAEELLFPTLRLFQPYLFVMEKRNTNNYGWISPVTQKQVNYNRQAMYACQ